MISSFSILSALVVYSGMLVGICLLSKRTNFLEKGGGSVLWAMSVAAVLRLLLPFEIPLTYEIRFWKLLGIPQKFLRAHSIVVYMLVTVWTVVGVAFMAWDLWMLHVAYKRCRGYTIVENERVQKIAARTKINCPVLVSPDVEIPYVVGIFHCTIYLPDAELSERNTELILLHEAQHIRTHDAFVRLVFGLLSEAVWWNFLARPFQRAIDKILEMRCDENVTKGMSEAEKTEYLAMLTEMAGRAASSKKEQELALAMNEFRVVGKKETAIEQRFKIINASGKDKSSRYIRLIGHCLVLILFCVSYLVLFQAAGVPSKEVFQNDSKIYYTDYDGPDIGDALNTSFIVIGSDGRYQLYINYKFSRYLSNEEVNSDQYQHLYIFEEVG